MPPTPPEYAAQIHDDPVPQGRPSAADRARLWGWYSAQPTRCLVGPWQRNDLVQQLLATGGDDA